MFTVKVLNSDLLCFFLLFVILDTLQCVCNVMWYLMARRVSLPLYSGVEIHFTLICCLIVHHTSETIERIVCR